ncbi:MAG: FKBP-type peptidyl-prolyl cis-trans isomerase [Bdellovibrionales bacterium]|nr:FKBP-type peptidyl-prolyl cis-trans isomerase [Bdellovibrionales bacterium]
MRNKLGQVLSSSFNHDVINQDDGNYNRLPGLVQGLQAVRVGEKRNIVVPADSAYGRYDPRLIIEVRRSELEYGDRLKLGSQVLRFHEPTSEQKLFRVVQMNEDSVVLDGNHSLAGHDLVFEVEIVSARDADDSDLTDASTLIGNQLLH